MSVDESVDCDLIFEYTVQADGQVERSSRMRGAPAPGSMGTTFLPGGHTNESPTHQLVSDPVVLAYANAHILGVTGQLFHSSAARIAAEVARIRLPGAEKTALSGLGIRMEISLARLAADPLLIVPYAVQWQLGIDGQLLMLVNGSGSRGISLQWSKLPSIVSGPHDRAKMPVRGVVQMHADDIEDLVRSLGATIISGLDRWFELPELELEPFW